MSAAGDPGVKAASATSSFDAALVSAEQAGSGQSAPGTGSGAIPGTGKSGTAAPTLFHRRHALLSAIPVSSPVSGALEARATDDAALGVALQNAAAEPVVSPPAEGSVAPRSGREGGGAASTDEGRDGKAADISDTGRPAPVVAPAAGASLPAIPLPSGTGLQGAGAVPSDSAAVGSATSRNAAIAAPVPGAVTRTADAPTPSAEVQASAETSIPGAPQVSAADEQAGSPETPAVPTAADVAQNGPIPILAVQKAVELAGFGQAEGPAEEAGDAFAAAATLAGGPRLSARLPAGPGSAGPASPEAPPGAVDPASDAADPKSDTPLSGSRPETGKTAASGRIAKMSDTLHAGRSDDPRGQPTVESGTPAPPVDTIIPKPGSVDPSPQASAAVAAPSVSSGLVQHGVAGPAAAGFVAGGAPIPVAAGVALSNVPIEIGLRTLGGTNHFEIRLDPVELGRIDVRLDIDGKGNVKAHLTVDRPETLAFLQRDSGNLDRAFEQAGLKPADGGTAFSLRGGSTDGQGQGTGGQSPGDGRSSRPTVVAPLRDPATSDPTLAAAPRRFYWGRASALDLRI